MPILSTSLIKRLGAGGLTNAGSFASVSALEAAWPSPQDGMFAAVGIDGSSGDEALYLSDGGIWSEVSGGGGVPEAPIDGSTYGRKDGSWEAIAAAAPALTPITGIVTAQSGKTYLSYGGTAFTNPPTPADGDSFMVYNYGADNATVEINGKSFAGASVIVNKYATGTGWTESFFSGVESLKSADFTASPKVAYVVTGGAVTVTSPGTGYAFGETFTCVLASGTMVVGGVTYSTVGDVVMGYFDGLAWNFSYLNRPSLPLAGGSLSGAVNEFKGSDIASAATTDIGAATGNFVDVTGTTTITGLGTIQAGTMRSVRFTGALTLTHNATSLILPTGANITTVAGDTAEFCSLGSGNWVCTQYQRKDGTPLAGGGGGAADVIQMRSFF